VGIPTASTHNLLYKQGKVFITNQRCGPSPHSPSCAVTLFSMGSKLKRYYGAGHLHFITCSCYRRQPLLGTPRRRDLFLAVLEQVRRRYQFVVGGYVVMPEHIHLLISEPQDKNPSTVMQALKLGFARRVLAQVKRRHNPAQASLFDQIPQHVWQRRFYDFNVWTEGKRIEKLRYMHRNPGSPASPVLACWGGSR